MNTSDHTPEIFDAAFQTTTDWREWLGWFGSIMWSLSMINWYEYLMQDYSEANVYGFSLVFKLLFLLAILGFSHRYGRDPDGIGQVAHYTAPVAFLLSGSVGFAPVPLGSVLYALSPVFFAPALIRRAYGVIRTAKPGYTFTFYMLAIGVAFVPMNAFMDFVYYNDTPLTIAYLVGAVFALIAWVGIRRPIDLPHDAPELAKIKVTGARVCFLSVLFLVTFWLFKMKCILDYTMEQFDYFLYVPVYIVLPGVYFTLLGYIGDKKRERPVVISVFIAYLIFLQLAFLLGDPTSTQNKLVIPLVVLNHLVGNIIEYFLYIVPLFFFDYSKRPVLIAPLGVASYLVLRTVRWVLEPFFPEATYIQDLTSLFPGMPKLNGFPLLVSTAVSAIVFLFMINMVYERYREKTLAASLHALLHNGADNQAGLSLTETPAMAEPLETTPVAEEQSMDPIIDAWLTPEEIRVALLLIDGMSQRDICRSLGITASTVSHMERDIRRKLSPVNEPDPVVSAVAAEYKLTKRETQMLRYLWENKGNSEIAAELFLSEETVKIHVRNLLKKLSMDSRHEVSGWLDRHGTQ